MGLNTKVWLEPSCTRMVPPGETVPMPLATHASTRCILLSLGPLWSGDVAATNAPVTVMSERTLCSLML